MNLQLKIVYQILLAVFLIAIILNLLFHQVEPKMSLQSYSIHVSKTAAAAVLPRVKIVPDVALCHRNQKRKYLKCRIKRRYLLIIPVFTLQR